MLQAAAEVERDAFLAELAERRTSDSRAAVVGAGYHPERAVQTGNGPVKVKVPKVRAKDGSPVRFCSALVPPYVRKAKSIEAALPWLYLKGISTGEMGAALKMQLGPEATGDGAIGFWAVLEEVFPTTRQQGCWVHKAGNVELPAQADPTKGQEDAA